MSDIDVVIPSRKIDKYLGLAMKSIAGQEGVNARIILVWDRADSPRLPSDWPEAVVTCTGRHVGTPGALNLGLGKCATDYVARLDADDVAESGRLKRQLDYLSSNPSVKAVGSAATLIGENGEILGNLDVSADPARELLNRNPIIHSSVTYSRRDVLELGGYDERMQRMQDYELFCRLALRGPLANMDDRLVRYRLHSSQNSKSNSPFKEYTRVMLRRRSILARELGRSAAIQEGANVLWWLSQVARYWGLRRPRNSPL